MHFFKKIYKSIGSSNPDLKKLFSKSAIDFSKDDLFDKLSLEIINQPDHFRRQLEYKCSRQQMPEHVTLRVLLLWHHIINQSNSSTFRLEIGKEQRKTKTLIETYKEYLSRRSMLPELDFLNWNIKEWVRNCSQIVKIMGLAFQLEMLIEVQWNRFKAEHILPVVSTCLISDCRTLLEILFTFVRENSKLIIEDHPDAETLNCLYEHILHIGREAERKLGRINSSKQMLPTLNVDRELNKKIQLFMARRIDKLKKREGSTHTSLNVAEHTEDEMLTEAVLVMERRPCTTKDW